MSPLLALLLVGCASQDAPQAPLPATVTKSSVTKTGEGSQGGGGTQTGPESSSTTAPIKADPPAGTPANPQTQEGAIEKGLVRRKKPYNAVRLYQLDELQVVNLKAGEKSYYCYVMDTMSKMMEGCMHLEAKELAEDEAMIFAYPDSRPLSFWMKNTRIDLDIAFLSDKKVVLNVETMQAFDETGVPSKGNAMYAVEFRSGVCKKNGIKPGMKFVFTGVKARDE